MGTIQTFKINRRLSETLPVALLLAITGGFLDAYTYLFRGGVFANGQTGNLVLLGIRIAEKDWMKANYYVLPICTFLLGVLMADCIRFYVKNDKIIKWRHVILIVEIGVLIIALLSPQGDYDSVVNISISFVCALQTQSFRSLNGKPYISVMCTGNMRSAMGELTEYIQAKDKKRFVNSIEYISVVFFFIGGAFIGTVFVDIWEGDSLWFPIIILMIVFAILMLRNQILHYRQKIKNSYIRKEETL